MNLVRRHPMPLPSYRPRSVEDQFGRLVETMFEDMLAPFSAATGMPQWQPEGAASPRLNVTETDQAFDIQAEMPGVNKEDVKVSVENQRVTIEGECQKNTEQKEGENLVYAERSARKYLRSFTLPGDIDEGAAQARMENGVLNLSIPKKQGGAATRIAIQ
jgi:HSP20 family protein